MTPAFSDQLRAAFGADRVRAGAPLAPFTTFRVGGPADWLLEARSADEVVAALRLAAAAGVEVTLLGGGSNVLVSDTGVRGLVIRVRGCTIVPEQPPGDRGPRINQRSGALGAPAEQP